MVKILHITTAHPADDVRILYKECRHLAFGGFDVALAAPGPVQDLGSVKHVPLGPRAGRLNRLVLLYKAWNLLRREKPALCHIHDPELLIVGWLHAVFGGLVVYDAHEFYVQGIKEKRWIPKSLRALVASVFDVVERIAARRIHFVVTADAGQNSRYERLGCEVLTMANLPVGTDYPNGAEWLVRRRVVHVGALSSNRGLNVIVATARLLQSDGVEFVLVGELRGAMCLPDNVHVTGRVPPDRVPAILSEGGIGLCALLKTDQYQRLSGAPTKVFEYLAAGLPVVLSDIRSHEQVVATCNCGVTYQADNPQACAGAILSLLNNPVTADACSRSGRAFFDKFGSWESQMPRLLSLYERAIGRAERTNLNEDSHL